MSGTINNTSSTSSMGSATSGTGTARTTTTTTTTTDPYQSAALCTAAALGDVSSRDARLVHSSDYDRRTALHIAAAQGRHDVVQLLLEAHANVNAEDRWHGTPLQDALRLDDSAALVQLLRQHGAAVGNLDHLAAAFLKAAAAGDVAAVGRALREGVPVDQTDYDHRTALHVAAANGHVAAVQALLDAGADVSLEDRFGGTAVLDAVRHQHDAVVKVLVAAGASLVESDTNVAAMCAAAMEGDAQTVRRLLDGGQNINAGDYDQRTALHLAAAEGHAVLVAFLIDHGIVECE
jgi:ankyrin repeat protein